MRIHKLRLAAAALALPLVLAASTAWSAEAPPEAAPSPESDTLRRAEAYVHLMRANLAARRGSIRTAMTEIRRAIEIVPDSAALQAEGANVLLYAGRRSDAEKLARSALRLDPDQPVALKMLAQMLAAQTMSGSGDGKAREEALRLYARLAEDPEADESILRGLAHLRWQSGDLAGAAEVLRRLATRREGDPQMVTMLSQVLVQDGRQNEALGVLLDFMVRYGAGPALLEQIGGLAETTGSWALVEGACSRRLERHPDSAAMRKLRGEALLSLRRFPEAAQEIERAVELDPGDPLVRFELYSAYDAMGRLADAADVARELAELIPKNPGAHSVLGEALARQGKVREAIESLRSALAGFTGEESPLRRDEVRWRIAELYLSQDLVAEAGEMIQLLEQPEHADGLELRFRLALAAGDLPAARRAVERLLALESPKRAPLIEGELLVREGKLGKARGKFKEAISALGLPVSAPIAEIWRRAGHPDDGEQTVRAWARAEPENADARFSLGSYLERSGRFEEAEHELESAIRLDPSHANALNYLGYSLADRNLELERALELVSRALEIEPWNGAYLDSLGWIYYQMGRYREAREPLERAARELPLDPTVLDHLGDLYLQLGKRDLALSMWRRALEAEPENPEKIRQKIDGGQAPGGPSTRVRPVERGQGAR